MTYCMHHGLHHDAARVKNKNQQCDKVFGTESQRQSIFIFIDIYMLLQLRIHTNSSQREKNSWNLSKNVLQLYFLKELCTFEIECIRYESCLLILTIIGGKRKLLLEPILDSYPRIQLSSSLPTLSISNKRGLIQNASGN